MAQATKEAIDAARDDDSAIVSFNDALNKVYVTWTGKVNLEAENLISDSRFLLTHKSARTPEVTIFKSLK